MFALQQRADFSAIINRKKKFEIDLSEFTLIGVLEAYQAHKRRIHPNYELGSVISTIKKIEVMAGGQIYPDDVSDLFYATMVQWMTNCGLKYNTQTLYCSQIRAALNWGIRHRCPVSSTYDKFDIPSYVPFTIALTPDEVSHIAHFDIDNIPCRPQKKKTLKCVRDHFVLSCQFGQRYSDMVRITKENFTRHIFSCVQQKTGIKCHLDIDRFAMHPALTYRILERYDYSAPWTGDITNYDKYIKEILRYIGDEFLDEFKIEMKVNGKIVETRKKKWELVASHTARRTFATYNSFRDVPIGELMKATGHKSMSCFSRYIKFGE